MTVRTDLYSWVERGTLRIECLAKEHNTMTRLGFEPGPLDPESSALTTRPPCLPHIVTDRIKLKQIVVALHPVGDKEDHVTK